MEIGDSLEHEDGWERVKKLIELAKSAERTTLSPARRQRIREGLLQRLERDRIDQAERRRRRQVAGAFVAGASTVLLAGLLLKLVSGGGSPGTGPSSRELARHQAAQHSVAE